MKITSVKKMIIRGFRKNFHGQTSDYGNAVEKRLKGISI